jgi:hypothetical protein
MTMPPPAAITLARWIAAVQAVMWAIAASFAAFITVAVFLSDRADARAGNPSEWAGLGEIVGAVASAAALTGFLLITIPAARLRRHRPMPRIVLSVVEIVTGAPIVACSTASVHGTAAASGPAIGVLYSILAVGALIALNRPSARRWAADA